ncbi:MAG: NAD(P)-dependent alcohol dehydrogenase [Verrucomicrobiae bacterium]|nr:NAD(P)-dependent alcohol dehydrogenase [Verrucomicrobiae bacterium]NNJ86357.1 NAD(P)-dependent alcohol dehydrogenase [Akkermansiaceae bacterium]
MQAYVLHGAEDIRLEQRPCPVPGSGELLVKVRAAGICGSDLHYYAHGRCGNFVPTRPFILGHEFAGEIVDAGDGVEKSIIGTRVAVDPSRPCGRCRLCRQGRYNLCPEMVYFGSASVVPPSDGCFAEYLVAPVANCVPLPDGFEFGWGALLEPLSVAAHAIERSGGVSGKTVLITGGGTIGQMILLLATAYGATQVVVSDIKPFARSFAADHGATATLDPTSPDCADQAASMAPDGFEVVFEAAGVAAALDQAFDFSARGATVVQVGTLPDGTEIPANALLTRELTYVGSWRFANVFKRVIELVVSGRIDVRPLITRNYPFEKLGDAIVDAGAADVIKVQIGIND